MDAKRFAKDLAHLSQIGSGGGVVVIAKNAEAERLSITVAHHVCS